MRSFTLTKWYLDCVNDAGELSIVYWARVGWSHLALTTVGVLTSDAAGVVSTASIAPVPPPQFADGVLRFDSPGISVEMQARTPSFERALLEDEQDSVKWRCSIPCGEALVRREGRPDLKGLGYAESLEMATGPWRLPLDELRWGRFLTERTSLVWIDWRGPRPLTIVLCDGIAARNAAVTDGTVTAGELSIDLPRDRVIRDSTLAATLHAVPGVRQILPERLLGLSETKWCSRSTLRRADEELASGWALHELVRFR